MDFNDGASRGHAAEMTGAQPTLQRRSRGDEAIENGGVRRRCGLQIRDEKDIRSGPGALTARLRAKERGRVVQHHATERETSVHRWSSVR
jgi:hypothetical protein